MSEYTVVRPIFQPATSKKYYQLLRWSIFVDCFRTQISVVLIIYKLLPTFALRGLPFVSGTRVWTCSSQATPPPPAVLTNPPLNLIYDLSQENRIKYWSEMYGSIFPTLRASAQCWPITGLWQINVTCVRTNLLKIFMCSESIMLFLGSCVSVDKGHSTRT